MREDVNDRESAVRAAPSLMSFAYHTGRMPEEVYRNPKDWGMWYEDIPAYEKDLMVSDFAAFLRRAEEAENGEESDGTEHQARKWLTIILPASIALHSVAYAPDWWQSILIFFGAGVTFRLLLCFYDLLRGNTGTSS